MTTAARTFGQHTAGVYLLLAATLLACRPELCRAQQEPGVQLLPPRTIVGVRSPLTVPYKRAYDASQKVRNETDGKAELVFALRDRSADAKAPLTLEIHDGSRSIPLALEAGGTFTLSSIEQPSDDAQLVVNRKAGEVGVRVDIRPQVPLANASASELRATIDAGRRARRILLPWYARLITPTVNSLKVCSESGGSIGWLDENGRSTPLSLTDSHDVHERPSKCIAVLSTSDPTPDTSRLQAPADTTYDYVGSLF